MESPSVLSIHATALVIGECGVLLRGPSGAGKSSLALDAIALGGSSRLVSLVGDDRTLLSVAGGRLLARGHPAIEGRIEQRGVGIVERSFEPCCVVHFLVDLIAAPARLPDDRNATIEILGIRLYHRELSVTGLSAPRLLQMVGDPSGPVRR